MAVLPVPCGSHATPNWGARVWFGLGTRFPNPGNALLIGAIGPSSLSVRPVSRSQRNPGEMGRLGRIFQVSPTYKAVRLSGPSPPAGKPSAGSVVEKPWPFPMIASAMVSAVGSVLVGVLLKGVLPVT